MRTAKWIIYPQCKNTKLGYKPDIIPYQPRMLIRWTVCWAIKCRDNGYHVLYTLVSASWTIYRHTKTLPV